MLRTPHKFVFFVLLKSVDATKYRNHTNGLQTIASSRLTMSIHWLCYCTVHVYVVIHFRDRTWSFWVESNMSSFVLVCLFLYCRWRSNYQRGVGSSYWFNPATSLCLSKARILNLNATSCCLFCVMNVCFVDIGGIVDNHCFIILHSTNIFCWFFR